MENVKIIVAKNLQDLRKAAGLTQAELAEKLNYSDKSVSKWEHAESLPDIEVLCKLADLYGVTLDFLTSEGSAEEKVALTKKEDVKTHANKIAVSALFVTSVWLIATMIFVYMQITRDVDAWMAYLWAVPASFVVLFFSNRRWGKPKFAYYLSSLFIWSLLITLCVQFIEYNIWAIVIIGLPIQVAIILISRIRK